MNIFFSPSYNPLLAKAQISISTHFGKKNKNQNFKTLISFCCQTLFLVHSQHFIKKIVFSRFGLGLYVRGNGGVKGLGNSILQLAFKI